MGQPFRIAFGAKIRTKLKQKLQKKALSAHGIAPTADKVYVRYRLGVR